MTNKVIIPKGSVEETLLIPLYGRMVASELFPFYYEDEEAKKIIARIDYDFSEMEKRSKKTFYRFGFLELAMRQSDLAAEVRDFLASHPKASAVNMGCGLDMTLEKVCSQENKIYNLDFPDVIKARGALIEKGANVKNLSYDIKDYSWMDELDGDNGIIFMGSGLFYYFLNEEVKSLFLELSRRFPGSLIVFDAANQRATKTMNKTYLKKSKMKATSFFSLEDAEKELSAWSSSFKVSSKGYMLGYTDFSKDKRIKKMYRFMAKLADGKSFKMRIVKVTL